MIQLSNVTKSFTYKRDKVIVLDKINLTLKKGESLALLGRNGAGKSTLLRILGGIDTPDSGEVETDCSISWLVGTSSGFQGSLTARENVTFVSKIYFGNDKIQLQKKIKAVKDFADIGLYFDRPINTYSKGMRARISFALSLAFDFDVYLLDEVTSAGDQRFRKNCAREIKNLRKKADVIVTTHNLNEYRDLDKAVIIHDSHIIEFDNISEAIKMHKEILDTPSSTGV